MTASSAFEEAFAFTQRPDIEGGFSNDPADRGGRTYRGLTQALYDSWRAARGLPTRPVEAAEDAEIEAVFREEFWLRCKCDQLPPMLALAVFDMAVTSGPTNATLTLQHAVHVRADGDIGPVTLAAIAAAPDVALEFLKARAGFIADEIEARPAQVKFLHGWQSRNLEIAWIASRA